LDECAVESACRSRQRGCSAYMIGVGKSAPVTATIQQTTQDQDQEQGSSTVCPKPVGLLGTEDNPVRLASPWYMLRLPNNLRSLRGACFIQCGSDQGRGRMNTSKLMSHWHRLEVNEY
jgi:hypothetical protein